MKKSLIFLVAFLVGALSLAAQSHSATLSWTASTTAGLAAYNIYRAPCNGTITAGVCSSEGVFAKIGATANGTTLTYTDNTVLAGLPYSYYATSLCAPTGCSISAGGESIPSNHYAVVIPKDLPTPPSGLGLVSVTFNATGANGTLAAQWVDAPSIPTRYTLTSGNTPLAAGSLVNSSGIYSWNWMGKIKPGAQLVFKVCDATGACTSQSL